MNDELLINERAEALAALTDLPLPVLHCLAAAQLHDDGLISGESFAKEKEKFVGYLAAQCENPDGVNFIALDRVGV